MKRILISLALMLRVWFSSHPDGDSPVTGLVIGNTAKGNLIVAVDNIGGKKVSGATVFVNPRKVEMSKWVEVKAERDK